MKEKIAESIKNLLLTHGFRDPETQEEYEIVKSSYERLLNKYSRRIENKEKLLPEIDADIARVLKDWKKAVSTKKINNSLAVQEDKLQKMSDKLGENFDAIKEKYDELRSGIIASSNEEIEKRVADYRSNLQEMIATRDSIRRMPIEERKEKYKETKYNYNQILSQIEERLKKYPDENAIRVEIEEDICKRNPEYAKTARRYRRTQARATDAKDNLAYFRDNRQLKFEEAKNAIDSVYSFSKKSLERKKRRIENKIVRTKNLQTRMMNKYQEFLARYQVMQPVEPTQEKGNTR